MIRSASASPRSTWRLWGLALGTAVLGAGIIVSLAIGSRAIPLAETLDAFRAFDPTNNQHLVIRELRIPRTIVAVLTGLALGVAGAIMQAVTRNPLAEPGLLGINAGAALAVALGVTVFGLQSMLHYVWFAFAGAGLAGIAVFILGQAHETGTNPVRLVLAGAGLSVVLAAMSGIMILNADPAVFDSFRNWVAGSVDGRGLDVAAVLAVCVTIGTSVAMVTARNLNTVALGEDLGRALGVDIRMTWLLSCLSVALLAGAATAGAGPIGFAGLVAPHIARKIAGPDYRWILPCSALFAANLLLFSDIIGRIIAPPSEIAAGIVAALIGGPFFVIVVRRFRMVRL